MTISGSGRAWAALLALFALGAIVAALWLSGAFGGQEDTLTIAKGLSARAAGSGRFAAVFGLAFVAALAAAGALLLLNNGKEAVVQQAPGAGIFLPNSTIFVNETTGSLGSAGAYQLRAYGTDATADDILAFYDAELGKAGYRPTAPTPDTTFRFDQDKMIRQYANG